MSLFDPATNSSLDSLEREVLIGMHNLTDSQRTDLLDTIVLGIARSGSDEAANIFSTAFDFAILGKRN